MYSDVFHSERVKIIVSSYHSFKFIENVSGYSDRLDCFLKLLHTVIANFLQQIKNSQYKNFAKN